MKSSKSSLWILGIFVVLSLTAIALISLLQRNELLRAQPGVDEPGVGDSWPQRVAWYREEYKNNYSSCYFGPSPSPSQILIGALLPTPVEDALLCYVAMPLLLKDPSFIFNVKNDAVDEITRNCIASYPNLHNNFFAQLACSFTQTQRYILSNNITSPSDPGRAVCRDFAQVIKNQIGSLLATNYEYAKKCPVGLQFDYLVFQIGDVNPCSHAVNTIKICPQSGPNKDKCFRYVYDNNFPHSFYPYDDLTINYHKKHSYNLPQLCADLTETDSPLEKYTVILYKAPNVGEGDPPAGQSAGSYGVRSRFWLEVVDKLLQPVSNHGGLRVDYHTEDSTATAGGDYLPQRSSIFIPDGKQGMYVEIDIISDLIYETAQSFIVKVDRVADESIVGAVASGTIDDDDSSTTSPTSSPHPSP